MRPGFGFAKSRFEGVTLAAFGPTRLFFDGVHIHSCGNGHWRFRPYGESLLANARSAGPAKRNQKVSPLTYGPSPRLQGPLAPVLLRGPAAIAIHGRGRLPRHPCRGAHCAEPALGLPTGQIKIKSKIKSGVEPVGASLLAKDVRTPRSFRQHALSFTSFASRLAPTGECVRMKRQAGR